tara:strand:- start:436 stop:807 length:372 start_codon:yes stop_codon:yes gene_type:complete
MCLTYKIKGSFMQQSIQQLIANAIADHKKYDEDIKEFDYNCTVESTHYEVQTNTAIRELYQDKNRCPKEINLDICAYQEQLNDRKKAARSKWDYLIEETKQKQIKSQELYAQQILELVKKESK